MSSSGENNRDEEILRDIRSGREFTLADFIAQEGGNFLKGESPVPKLVQVVTEINIFIAHNLSDTTGALQLVLQKWIKDKQNLVSRNQDTPLLALREMLEMILNNEEMLYELVRQVDFRWGQITGERPYFQTPGQPAHPDDEYTHDSVAEQLGQLLEIINQHQEESSN